LFVLDNKGDNAGDNKIVKNHTVDLLLGQVEIGKAKEDVEDLDS
jgi:hypothetical protein